MARSRPSLTAVALALALAGGLGMTALLRWFWTAADPGTEMVLALKSAERTGLEVEIPGADSKLVAPEPRWDRLTVELVPGQPTAFVTATLDLEGKVGDVPVHSLGYERVRFERDADGWRAPDGLAPLASRAVKALWARWRALEAGNLPALAALSHTTVEQARADPALASFLRLRERRYRVKGWYLRLEREGALASEDYRLTGTAPDRPVDEEGTRRLELRQDDHGEFYFARGLM